MLLQLIRNTVALLILTTSLAARGEVPEIKGEAPAQSKPLDQVLYKGVVGNLLDAAPIDPDRRVELQRTNAVVSSVFSGRSLAVLLGVANPVLMVGGLVWGIWSASKIKPVTPVAQASVPKPSLPVVPLLSEFPPKPAVTDSGATHGGTARPAIEPLADASAAQASAD
ncbi:MAG TPA: hypothetical protein VM164_06290 [Burkholderiales bacterium]|nr:hypothetical protein [Burkholderiales bacterium]